MKKVMFSSILLILLTVSPVLFSQTVTEVYSKVQVSNFNCIKNGLDGNVLIQSTLNGVTTDVFKSPLTKCSILSYIPKKAGIYTYTVSIKGFSPIVKTFEVTSGLNRIDLGVLNFASKSSDAIQVSANEKGMIKNSTNQFNNSTEQTIKVYLPQRDKMKAGIYNVALVKNTVKDQKTNAIVYNTSTIKKEVKNTSKEVHSSQKKGVESNSTETISLKPKLAKIE